MDLTLILNLDQFAPQDRRVQSLTNRAIIGLPDGVLGETYQGAVYLIDNAGAYQSFSGQSGYSPRIGIGLPGSNPLVEILPASFTQIANGWSFDLGLTTSELIAAVTGQGRRQYVFEFELLLPGGQRRKYYQRPYGVLPRVVNQGTGPTPTSSYFTSAETLALFLGNQACTALTGGAATALDGLAVTGVLTAGAMKLVYLASTKELLLYRLLASGDAESAPWIVAPDDGSSLRWNLVGPLFRDGLPLLYNADQTKFHQLFVRGTSGLEQVVVGPGVVIGTP